MALNFLSQRNDTTNYEGEEIFRFVAGVREDEIERLHTPIASSRKEDLKSKGARIRELCDEFERSPQGREVRKLVDEIEIEDLTEDDLQEVLGETIDSIENTSWFRIAGFFTFCKNLFIRGCRLIINIINIYRFITNIVSKAINWVKSLFGW